MRALIISDIHGNLVALETVLDQVKDEIDAVWCLGDIVGYGPNPNECISLLKEQADLLCLLGNHDAAAAKNLDISKFNPEARRSIEWTKKELTKDSLTFLQNLPETEKKSNITLVHGSPRQPVLEYLLDTQIAKKSFDFFDTDYCFVGHTHLPTQFQLTPKKKKVLLSRPLLNKIIHLRPRSIFNPGSVGQPRDKDPRAAFAIFDTKAKTWDYRRVVYDVKETQKRMKALKMNARHITRIGRGW